VATIAAVLDACVLYPARLRDLLLSLAAADLFRPIWSDMIHEEWITNVLTNRPDLTRRQLDTTRDRMNQAFPDALVRGFEPIIPTLTLPDSDDRHILACAIYARADLIVTINLTDFPLDALIPQAIAAAHPDAFVDYLFAVEEERSACGDREDAKTATRSVDDAKGIHRIHRAGGHASDRLKASRQPDSDLTSGNFGGLTLASELG
jgi:hypothetical protein